MRRRSFILIYLLIAATACAPGASPLPQAPSLQPANPSPPAQSNVPIIGPATRLDIGATARSRVELTDPACFYNWDVTGRCRFFEVVPTRDGELRAVLIWSTASGFAIGLMDLFIVEPDQSWTYGGVLKEEKRALVREVKAGKSYVFIAMAYGEAVDFELTVLM